MVEGLPVKRGGHNPLQLLGSEIFLPGFWTHRLVSCKRIGGNDAVCNGFSDNGLQLHGQVDDGSGSKAPFRSKIQIVLVDERTVQCGKRNVG